MTPWLGKYPKIAAFVVGDCRAIFKQPHSRQHMMRMQEAPSHRGGLGSFPSFAATFGGDIERYEAGWRCHFSPEMKL